MPAKQSLIGQGLVVPLRRIQHHFHHTFDCAISGLQADDVHAEPARDRRADLSGVEFLPFDFAALHDIVVIVRRTASSLTLKPSASICPSSRPCLCRAPASGAATVSWFQLNCGQSESSWI